MTTPLNPRWNPLPFPIPPGAPLFDPILLHERGLLIAGGPDGLTLFAIGDRRSVFAKIPKRSWINGFTAHGTSLYVQDGPVLLGVDLMTSNPFAAINLVTGACWPDPGDEAPPTAPPDDLFKLDPANTLLQDALNNARRTHCSTLPGEQADLLGSSLSALDKATRDATRIVFSPPVVRSQQIDARQQGQIFSLRMDGKIHAMDDGLRETETFAAAAPLRAELVMAELPQTSGEVRCHLYYVSATGSIVALDASGDLRLLPDWPATGTPIADKVLPLRFVDGHLMGGGILGHDFFALKPDPSKPPVITVKGPDTGWRQYDVASAEKLVLVSDGLQSRLVSYHPSAGTRDRWQLRSSSAKGFSLFWTETGSDAVLPGPKLALEVDLAAPNATTPPGLRVVFANTIDSPNDGFRTDYPPSSTTIETATLVPGPWAGKMKPLALFPCRPIISQQMLFCVYRSAPAADPAGTCSVTAFALNGLLGTVLPAANRRLEELKLLVTPIRLQVMRHVTIHREWPEPGTQWTEGPFVYNNAKVTIIPSPGTPFELTTDNEGMLTLDPAFTGRSVIIDSGKLGIKDNGVYCRNVILVSNKVNTIQIEVYIERFK
jgi:hypothetical protein